MQWTESEAIRDSVRRFCTREYPLSARIQATAAQRGFDMRRWQACAEQGYVGSAVPEQYGGTGGSPWTSMTIAEEFGRALVTEPFVGCAVHVARLMLTAARDDQQRMLLPALCEGREIFVFADGTRNAPYVDPAITVSYNGDKVVLNGMKTTVIDGGAATYFIIAAVDTQTHAARLFFVNADTPQLTIRRYPLLDGSIACDLRLDNVQIPASAELDGCEDLSLAMIHARQYAVLALCATCIGAMDSAITHTRDYLKIRSQYGARLHTYQALQHRMADMLIALESARALYQGAVHVLETVDPISRDRLIAATHIKVMQSSRFIAANSVQLHGAIGFTDSHIVGLHFKQLAVASNAFGGIDGAFASLLADIAPARPSQTMMSDDATRIVESVLA